MNRLSKVFSWGMITLVLIASACNLPKNEDKIAGTQTAILETVIAGITQTVAAKPSATTSPTMLPSSTPLAMPTASGGIATLVPAPPTVPISACNKAAFVGDVTIPDGSVIAPGATFKKTWRLQNAGTCTWDPNYAIIYVAGEKMGAPDSATLTNGAFIGPGGTVDVSLTLTAPTKAGDYITYFRLRAADGSIFGIAQAASGSFYVQIKVVGPTATGTAPTSTYTPTPNMTLTSAAAAQATANAALGILATQTAQAAAAQTQAAAAAQTQAAAAAQTQAAAAAQTQTAVAQTQAAQTGSP